MFLQYNSHHRNAAALPIPNIFCAPKKKTVHSLFRKDKRLFFPSYPPVCVVGGESLALLYTAFTIGSTKWRPI